MASVKILRDTGTPCQIQGHDACVGNNSACTGRTHHTRIEVTTGSTGIGVHVVAGEANGITIGTHGEVHLTDDAVAGNGAADAVSGSHARVVSDVADSANGTSAKGEAGAGHCNSASGSGLQECGIRDIHATESGADRQNNCSFFHLKNSSKNF